MARVSDERENPVASGLIALVAVAVVVGILAGIAALMLTRMFGIDDDSTVASTDPADANSLYLPEPVPTTRSSGPLITLAPSETASTPAGPATPAQTTSAAPSRTPDTSISLSPGATSVGAGEELLLTGTYESGEGAVLDIFYNVANSGWEEFPLDVNVSGGIFQTHVATYKTGTIKWRVQDASNGKKSNPVSVRHG
jgi:hypothetical protein